MNLGDKETLYEKDGWLYVRCEIANWSKPERHIHYWPTGIRMLDFAMREGFEEANKRIGMKLTYQGNGVYYDEKFTTYRLQDGSQTKPAWTETESIPEPKQRGKKLETTYRDGAWHKYTARGWVLA